MAAAKALSFPSTFRRNSFLRGLNLLVTLARLCSAPRYCRLNQTREVEAQATFSRVQWPTYAVDDIIERLNNDGGQLRRVCVGMITHPRAFDDTNTIIHRFHTETNRPVSALISPTAIRDPKRLVETRQAGADIATVAIDAATPELFDLYRGHGVRGPHSWELFWETVEEIGRIFGRGKAGVHLVVGLGETEQQMVAAIQRAYDLGAATHLFSFFPEAGTSMENHPQPSYGHYRRVHGSLPGEQKLGRYEQMTLTTRGGSSISASILPYRESIQFSSPFMTSGLATVGWPATGPLATKKRAGRSAIMLSSPRSRTSP